MPLPTRPRTPSDDKDGDGVEDLAPDFIGLAAAAATPSSSPKGLAAKTRNIITAEALISSENNWGGLAPLVYETAREIRDKLATDDHELTEKVEEARKQGHDYSDYEYTRNAVRLLVNTKVTTATDFKFANLGRDQSVFIEMVLNEVVGLGPLEPLWSDEYINEIMIDGPDYVRIEKEGQKYVVNNCRFASQEHLLEICDKIVAAQNRQVDLSHPIVDARLPDLSRVNIVHPSIASGGPYVTIRRHRKDPWTMEKYIEKGGIDPEMARDLSFWVESGCSTIIIGGTSSGKTSVLNSLAGQIPPESRLVVIEDNRELDLPIHALYEESRNAASSGAGVITLDDLVRNALRQAPERIIVGEARDGNAMQSLLDAMSTGHNGSISTIHANGAQAGVSRIVNMIQRTSTQTTPTILDTIANAVDLFVTIARFPEDGSRRMTGIYEVPVQTDDSSGHVELKPIPLWEYVVDNVDRTPGHRKVYGHWEKKNDISEELSIRYRIERENLPTLEQVNKRSNGDWS